MKPVARLGDMHVCGNSKHPPSPIITGGKSVVDGAIVARIGDKCACGAVIVEGSSQASENGVPIAFLGAKTQCGSHSGKITTGAPQAKVKP
ncbi:PAAR domain-containing protein [Ningiella sp. W23]|uniref:PAAR domain-containing protein n=1 Tax=Ningiella sp. W23 TaxID=3023715 RepID=UPI00375639C2